MIPAPFDFVRVDNAEAALSALAEHGDEAKLLAGGQSLLPLMKLRLATPAVLVDVSRARDLAYVRRDGDVVAIGALTRHCDVARDETVRSELPILAQVASLVGDPQVRHRGTIGGSVSHSDPASDLPTVLFAVDAEMVVRGPGGERTIPALDFNRLSFRSNLVLRWEWLPGSTAYFIWQQNRFDETGAGGLIGPNDLWSATQTGGDNFFVVKVSYWLGVN